ncbi:hypothetical protein [Arthrobacter sp. ERGS1:01]|uniref:hypothetical protein n=1 Tax=Arthrobacter sp. ERGS1:01 TaxID=1704044 RepID=UPI0006B4CA68|nr:hypothetical protein [Arthrobacter sp. ERGS1:01]
MTEQNASTTTVAPDRKNAGISKAVFGPLTARDVTVLGAVLVIFVASVLPIVFTYGLTGNLWNVAGLYFTGIGVILPLVVGALFGIRRMSPELKLRVGSLSVDQFASVVASFATAFFFLGTVTNFKVAYLVGLIGALILLAATVLAQWIPVFAADYANRAEVTAHPAARDAVPAVHRPAAPKPALALPAGAGSASASTSGTAATAAAAAAAAAAKPQYGQKAPGKDAADKPAAGQAAAGQPGFGWNAGPQAAGHTSAGQIFTPADASATQQATAPAAAASAATSAPATAATAAAGAETAEPQGVKTAGVSAGDANFTAEAAEAAPETRVTPEVPSASTAPETEEASAESAIPAEAVAEETADAGTGVEPVQEAAPATMLHPKVTESEPVREAPVRESIGATVDPQAAKAAVVADPFWFAVDRPQNVVDEHSRQFVFKLTPGSWILALEDRGTSFLVQDSHGKTGVLLDLVGIERAPEGS